MPFGIHVASRCLVPVLFFLINIHSLTRFISLYIVVLEYTVVIISMELESTCNFSRSLLMTSYAKFEEFCHANLCHFVCLSGILNHTIMHLFPFSIALCMYPVTVTFFSEKRLV